MSEVHKAMAMVEVPPNFRETLLPRKDMLWLNVRLSLGFLAFNILCTLAFILFSIIFIFGVDELHNLAASDYMPIISGVCFGYAFMIVGGLLDAMRKMNLYGVPIVYGYTQELLYGASSLHQSVERWEIYTHWKETGSYFLLCSQGQWNVIPKNVWTGEEQEELRLIMKNKVGKPYAIPRTHENPRQF